MMLAASTTRPVSAGKVCACAVHGNQRQQRARQQGKRAPDRVQPGVAGHGVVLHCRALELAFEAWRHFGARGRGFIGHHRLRAVEDLRADRVGEGADRGVIALHRLVVIAQGNADAVLLPFELALQHLVIGDRS